MTQKNEKFEWLGVNNYSFESIDDENLFKCKGMIITDIIYSKYFPSIGLVLDHNFILTTDASTPGYCGPCVFEIGDFWTRGDFKSFWN